MKLYWSSYARRNFYASLCYEPLASELSNARFSQSHFPNISFYLELLILSYVFLNHNNVYSISKALLTGKFCGTFLHYFAVRFVLNGFVGAGSLVLAFTSVVVCRHWDGGRR